MLYQLEQRAATTHDNRYAWRLNCASGIEYGIFPEDYETRDEYNEALELAKGEEDDRDIIDAEELNEVELEPAAFAEDVTSGIHCQVSRLDNGKTEGFWINNPNVRVGDVVEVGTETGVVQGVVVLVEQDGGM